MVNLVEQMLEAQKEAHNSSGKSESVIKIDKQRCDILDKQIDALVYELYGLTDDEIKIVEAGVTRGSGFGGVKDGLFFK